MSKPDLGKLIKIGAGIGDPLEGERCWDDLRIL